MDKQITEYALHRSCVTFNNTFLAKQTFPIFSNSFFFHFFHFFHFSSTFEFVAIFTTFFITLLFLLLINTKTILKILGIVLLPLYILKFVYDAVRPPKKFQQCIYDCDETINTHSKHSKKIEFNQFKNRTLFNELMYKKRLEIELEHNDTVKDKREIFSSSSGVIDLEDWKSK